MVCLFTLLLAKGWTYINGTKVRSERNRVGFVPHVVDPNNPASHRNTVADLEPGEACAKGTNSHQQNSGDG